MEKSELVERAAEAKAVLDARPKFPDAELYKELDVVLFARETCPYCVYAKDGVLACRHHAHVHHLIH